MIWNLDRIDMKGRWSWGEERAWTTEEWDSHIHPKLVEFSRLTWSEIDVLSSGSGHKMHHAHELGDVEKEAQKRWIDLQLNDLSDSLFRFRLGGTRRLWGFILQSEFFVVWYERMHMIYRLKK